MSAAWWPLATGAALGLAAVGWALWLDPDVPFGRRRVKVDPGQARAAYPRRAVDDPVFGYLHAEDRPGRPDAGD